MTRGDSEAGGRVAPEQAKVVALLSDPGTWRCDPGKIARIDTHGAHVFLAGDLAFKIKRAVKYAYMDFSTLQLRRAALERELEVNREAAPDIYQRVSAITREQDGSLCIEGRGVPVEFGLRMQRFDQSQLLSRQLAAGRLGSDVAKMLGDAVFESHARARVASREDGRSAFDAIISELAHALPGADEDGGAADDFVRTAGTLLDGHHALLSERARAGFVRRCHGDLHLDNVVMWHGRPTLFDAIEFDEEIATVDTLYDLAFLLMDLERHEARQAANEVMNRYLWRSGARLDLQGLAAMPLFLGLRAGIRAMVAAQRAALSADEERVHALRKARLTLAAGLRLMVPPAPRMIAIGGFSGTGKSTLAAQLAPRIGAVPGAVHLRSDLERKSMAGVAETERLPASAYTAEAAAKVYDLLIEKSAVVLEAGQAVVVDAVFSKPEERAAIEAVAAQQGAAFTGLWLEVPVEEMIRRVKGRKGDASDATADVVQTQLARGAGAVEWQQVDAGGSPAATLAAALRLI